MDISGEMVSLISAGLTAAVATVAILVQHAGNRRALAAQEDAARKFREHERRLTLDQRRTLLTPSSTGGVTAAVRLSSFPLFGCMIS
jgi:hypothetical protein